MTRLLTILLALLVGASSASADSLDERFDRALRALDAQHPAEAARELHRLVGLGIDDPDVYVNLGIAEAESYRYGEAMVAFERALSLRPSDDVARAGLDNAETMLARRRADESGGTATVEGPRTLASFGRAFPEPVASFGTLGAAYAAALALAALAFVRRESLRLALGTTAVVAALLLGTFGVALAGRARYGGLLAPGIVVTDEAEVRTAPDARAPRVATFREGERLDVLSRHGAFYRVATHGRPRGFVARRAIGTY